MDILQTFAEISVAVAGFASVVVAFRNRNNESWNHVMFQGMVGHAAMAFIFSCIPFLLIYFLDEQLVWKIASWIIGVLTLIQGSAATIFDKKLRLIFKIELMLGTIIVAVLQFLNITEFYFITNIGPCIVGVFWHLMQSILIFAALVLFPEDSVSGNIKKADQSSA